MHTTLKAPQLTPVWRRRLYRYRRWIAAALVGLAVLALATSLQPQPPAATSTGRPAPRPGYVAAPVALTDHDVANWLEPGDVVNVIATTGDGADVPTTQVVAENVSVLEVPTSRDGGFGANTASGLVVLEVRPELGTALAQAKATSALTVVRTS